jgi:hypothetical protein
MTRPHLGSVGTVTEWDSLPLTLRAQHIAAIYGLSLYQVRALVRRGDRSQIPAPAFISPNRWRKADVRKHFESASPMLQRLAQATRRLSSVG